jgi:hypothetical protein
MRVAGQREGGRVMAEGEAALEEVVPRRRCGGMCGSQPGRSCLPYERLEDARPQVGRVERVPDSFGKRIAVES